MIKRAQADQAVEVMKQYKYIGIVTDDKLTMNVRSIL